MERRTHTRVSMKDVQFSCYILARDQLCKPASLSLSGSYLECPVDLAVGDTCEVIITSLDVDFKAPLSLTARVVRVDDEGVALEFCDTDSDDYLVLQSILLYTSEEPHVIAAEFSVPPGEEEKTS